MTGILNVMLGIGGENFDAGPGGSFTDDDPSATGSASVQLEIEQDGDGIITRANSGSPIMTTWDWISIGALADSQQVRVDVTSGGFTSGSATGTDLATSSPRSWTVSSTGAEASVGFNLVLKDGAGNTRATANYTFSADAAGS